MALPFFFLAGNVMNAGGISERLVKLAMALVGHLRGGLAHVNVVVGMFFAGIWGSSTAEAAGIGTVFIPAMRKRGYDEDFTVCLTAASSTMGVAIPPGILMVVYGATSGASTGALLIGGILPGVCIHLGVIVVMTLVLGLLTLPYGLCSLTACAVAGILVTQILKPLHLMMIPILIVIVLCALVPGLVLAIPRLLVPKWVTTSLA